MRSKAALGTRILFADSDRRNFAPPRCPVTAPRLKPRAGLVSGQRSIVNLAANACRSHIAYWANIFSRMAPFRLWTRSRQGTGAFEL